MATSIFDSHKEPARFLVTMFAPIYHYASVLEATSAADPSFAAFLSSFSHLMDLADRLRVKQSALKKAWDEAFDRARREKDVEVAERKVQESVLDAVIAWKEAKKELEAKRV
ncbi:hypothetical protein JCM10213v2_005173 [Rhodosporidiobolus nylandii]